MIILLQQNILITCKKFILNYWFNLIKKDISITKEKWKTANQNKSELTWNIILILPYSVWPSLLESIYIDILRGWRTAICSKFEPLALKKATHTIILTTVLIHLNFKHLRHQLSGVYLNDGMISHILQYHISRLIRALRFEYLNQTVGRSDDDDVSGAFGSYLRYFHGAIEQVNGILVEDGTAAPPVLGFEERHVSDWRLHNLAVKCEVDVCHNNVNFAALNSDV